MLQLGAVTPAAEKNIVLMAVERCSVGVIIVDFRDGLCLGNRNRTSSFREA